jgi:hypothetical protein
MGYTGTSNFKVNKLGDAKFSQGIRSLAKQFLSKQVLPVQGDQNVTPPSRPLREAVYKR